jgi:hypothetical protein
MLYCRTRMRTAWTPCAAPSLQPTPPRTSCAGEGTCGAATHSGALSLLLPALSGLAGRGEAVLGCACCAGLCCQIEPSPLPCCPPACLQACLQPACGALPLHRAAGLLRAQVSGWVRAGWESGAGWGAAQVHAVLPRPALYHKPPCPVHQEMIINDETNKTSACVPRGNCSFLLQDSADHVC